MKKQKQKRIRASDHHESSSFVGDFLRRNRLKLVAPLAAVALSACAISGNETEPPRERVGLTEIEPTPEGIRGRQLELVGVMFEQHGPEQPQGGEFYEATVGAKSAGAPIDDMPDAPGEGGCHARVAVQNYRDHTQVTTYLECRTLNGSLRRSASSTYRSHDPAVIARMNSENTPNDVIISIQKGNFSHDITTVDSYDADSKFITTYTDSAAGVRLNDSLGTSDPSGADQENAAIFFAQQTLGGSGMGGLVEGTY